ncbi:metal-sensitive transcriptional regulator [Raineyella fluvialis]|uniref:metal-sensitive transcriptional regulator n=1 Tax=Raineyella fluvialis TaxID=2662261 RepID=UPI003BAE9D88
MPASLEDRPEVDDAPTTDGEHAEGGACCATDNPWGYADNKQDYVRRLRRIEGQVRGLQRMVDEDQYCIDILTQISAVTKALESTALRLLDEHLSHCVMHAIEAGGEEAEQKLAEASAAIARLVRS